VGGIPRAVSHLPSAVVSDLADRGSKRSRELRVARAVAMHVRHTHRDASPAEQAARVEELDAQARQWLVT
jgi:hypothetical protein